MNYNDIVSHLCNQGYTASIKTDCSKQYLETFHEVDGKTIQLRHNCEAELTLDHLPKFYLVNCSEYEKLAHVLPDRDSDLGCICIGDQSSLSVNFECPELAFEASLKRHIDLLAKAISDPIWNEQELLREFYSNWLIVCDQKIVLICRAAASECCEEITVLGPPNTKFKSWLNSMYLGVTDNVSSIESPYLSTQQKGRSFAGRGFVVPLNSLQSAPSEKSEIENWYLQAISSVELPNKFKQKRDKQFWIIFNAETPSGRTWFGVRLKYKKDKGKKTLPTTKNNIVNWSITPTRVIILNKEQTMPRSGGNLDLHEKSVLIVGCGSVGGEIAYKLGAAGVGKLTLCDPDIYSINNIYRHVLSYVNYYCWSTTINVAG